VDALSLRGDVYAIGGAWMSKPYCRFCRRI